MPTRKQPGFPSPDRDPDEDIVPAELVDDDTLWMLLNTYADGEASTEEALYVESLIRSYPRVARELSFLQLTADSVREFGEVEPPEALSSAIFARTARQKTLSRRMAAWWARTVPAFGPAPLRIGAAVLASSILAVALWSRHNGVRPFQSQSGSPIIVQNVPNRSNAPKLAAVPVKPHHAEAHVSQSRLPLGPMYSNPTALTEAKAPAAVTHLQNAVVKTVEHPVQVVKASAAPTDNHRGDSARIITDALPTDVVARNNVEERHMAAGGDPGAKTLKSDELGPDFDSATDAHTDEVAKATPAASHDEPPTATVEAVNYRPGSISAMTRNAPPAVPTLYMRTQEAIRRQHDMQQYGGYGKDAYKNIQRGEVGLSLVGGRF